MATMLNGAAVMDAALLLIAGKFCLFTVLAVGVMSWHFVTMAFRFCIYTAAFQNREQNAKMKKNNVLTTTIAHIQSKF